MAKAARKNRKSSVIWWAVGFAMTLVFGVLCFALALSWPGGKGGSAESGAAAQPGEAVSELEGFMRYLQDERYKPDFPIMEQPCPLHPLEKLPVPVKRLVGSKLELYGDNSFGGVATDLMKIGLGPPENGELIGEPSMARQEFDTLLATCPQTGATFSMQDLQKLRADGAAADRLLSWDLQAVCPPLAARDQADWSIDERRLARLLTQRCWGVNSVELGFTALTGAYVSNFSVYVGRDYYIEADAWYALAAAYFEQALEDGSLTSEAQRQVTRMTLGEMYRLLGDAPRALSLYEEVAAGEPLPQPSAEVLAQMTELARAGNTELQRAVVQNVPEPPVGWYLDKMLPGINAQIQYMRQQWGPQALGADWGQPEAILQRIIDGLPDAAAAAPGQ